MISISINYDLVWQLKDNPNYQFTQSGRCINVKRGKELKMMLQGYTKGYSINGKFTSLKQIRNKLEKVQINTIPF